MIGNLKNRLEKRLRNAGIKSKPEKYIENGIKVSLLASIIFWFLWSLFNGGFLEGIISTLIFFALCLTIAFIYPNYLAIKRASLIEKDLPFAMLGLSLHTKARLNSEKGIEKIAKGSYGQLSIEFGKVLEAVRARGQSLQDSLLELSERFDSRPLKRSIMQKILKF